MKYLLQNAYKLDDKMLFSGDPCGYATNSGNNDFDYEDAFNESDISNCNCTDPKYTYVPECDCDYPGYNMFECCQ